MLLSICLPNILCSLNDVFAKKPDHLTDNLGTNTIEHVSEMELYTILSTLEMFESWNRTVCPRNNSGWNGKIYMFIAIMTMTKYFIQPL